MPGKTLADVKSEEDGLYVNCTHPLCHHYMPIDIDQLIERLGADHGAMHNDLVGKFFCLLCREEGRERYPVAFTCIPNHAKIIRERLPAVLDTSREKRRSNRR